MICHVITFPPSSKRFPGRTDDPHQSHPHSSHCSWTQHRTGPRRSGSGSSAIFPEQSGTINTAILQLSNEEVPCLLHTVQCWGPFPVTEQLLCSYAAYLAEVSLAPQSIRSYLAAIRDMQISIGLPDPREQSSLPILKRVQAGISHTQASAGQPKRIRLPITTRLLRQIRSALDSSSNPEKIVLWAVCCTAFFGFFRLGELLPSMGGTFNQRLHLAWGDVAVTCRTPRWSGCT